MRVVGCLLNHKIFLIDKLVVNVDRLIRDMKLSLNVLKTFIAAGVSVLSVCLTFIPFAVQAPENTEKFFILNNKINFCGSK
jgi:hypothetical protein